MSPKEANEHFKYNPATGKITWKKTTCRRIRPGDEAGSLTPQGNRIIALKGKHYPATALIWLLCYNRFPKEGFSVTHLNGIRDDNRIENLSEVTRRQKLLGREPHPDSGKRNPKHFTVYHSIRGHSRYIARTKSAEEAESLRLFIRQKEWEKETDPWLSNEEIRSIKNGYVREWKHAKPQQLLQNRFETESEESEEKCQTA